MTQKLPQRILLVDDDEDIRRVGELALGRVGNFEVEPCAGGPEFLEVAPHFQPDLVLLDVMMPGMDGLAVYDAMAGIEEVAHVPVIFITAKAQTQEVARYLLAGAIGVIRKPFDPMTLADEVRAIWARAMEGEYAEDDEQKELHDMVVHYRRKLDRRLNYLDELLARVSRPDERRQALEKAQALAHKLAGSGAMFGMPEVSEACAKFEALTKKLLSTNEEFDRQDLEELRAICGGLRANVRPSSRSSPRLS